MPLLTLTLLFLFQLAGEAIKSFFNLPIPGAILGMLLLLAYLSLKPANKDIQKTCQQLISFLPLFFIPAGVGILAYVTELKSNATALSVSLIVGTVIGFVITLLILQRVLKR